MRNIINFRKDYSDALIVKLEQNYRSTKKIIAGANAVIKNNTSGIKKELWTNNNEGEHISYIEAPDDKIEASIIANIIKEKEGNYIDNLVLYRTNAQSRKIEEALMIANIPYRVI
jgi:DNA helicase-2/ATP-dependent DNA helicase PcrA